MRTAPSPLMREVEAHIGSIAPSATITENLPADSLIVVFGGCRAFQVRPPFRSSVDAAEEESAAAWPLHVTPIPSDPGTWECWTLDEIAETLQWPSVTPKARPARR